MNRITPETYFQDEFIFLFSNMLYFSEKKQEQLRNWILRSKGSVPGNLIYKNHASPLNFSNLSKISNPKVLILKVVLFANSTSIMGA